MHRTEGLKGASDMSRRQLMVAGMTAAALIGGTNCSTNPARSSTCSPSTIEEYLRCDPSPEQPTIDYAVVTDPTFNGGADPLAQRDSSDALRAAVASGKPVYIPPGSLYFTGPESTIMHLLLSVLVKATRPSYSVRYNIH